MPYLVSARRFPLSIARASSAANFKLRHYRIVLGSDPFWRRGSPASAHVRAVGRGQRNIRRFLAYVHFLCYFCSHDRRSRSRRPQLSESAETIPLAPARSRSIEARRAARLMKARREGRIVDFLNRGVSVAEIAAREEVTEKRMRALISGILARRMPEPPAEFLALQVSRLNEALLVAYSAMSGGNLGAVDRVVKIVRELDRYHGFSAADRRSHTRRIEAKAAGPLALAADRPEMAPQSLERIEFAPGNALVPAASN